MAHRLTVMVLSVVVVCTATTSAQMTYRLKGVVQDDTGKTVAGATVRAEALVGFRGEQFVGQKSFETTTNAKGEWTILGLTSGIWTFEASAPETVPQALVLPINFTNRKPQSATGGSFAWDLPMTVGRTTNAGLTAAAVAAMARRADEAVASVSALASNKDAAVLCSAGEVALFVRQHSLARALFDQALKQDPKSACGTRGLASSALMQNDLDLATKMLWNATELLPRAQRAAYGAALKDLQQIAGTK